MIEYPYHPRRAAQAAHYLLWRTGGNLDLYGVVKLLYLADRASLLQHGESITGDRLVSMEFGPAVSHTYNLIKGSEGGGPPGSLAVWNQYIKPRSSYRRILVERPLPTSDAEAVACYDELSADDRAILGEIGARYGHLSFEELRAVAHDLPEYEPVGRSSKPIDPATILRCEQWAEQDIEAVRSEAAADQAFRSLVDR